MTFRWPLVARSTLDRAELAHAQLTALHEQRERELRADLLSERTRTASLTATIIRLKRDGAVLLPPASTQLRQEARKLTPIEQAIDDNPRSRTTPGLAKHLLTWSELAKKKGMHEDDIVERLRSWGDPNSDDEDEEEPL